MLSLFCNFYAPSPNKRPPKKNICFQINIQSAHLIGDEPETELDYSKIFEDIKCFREQNLIAFLVENDDNY